MGMVDDLRIHFDYLSRTVLLQSRERSHVLRDGFSSKAAAERAAIRYAAQNWSDDPDDPRLKRHSENHSAL